MKIVADENIPLVEHYFGSEGELLLKPGREITRDDVIDADILLVRSVTLVNEALVKNTSLKFIGSATAGIDHVDTHLLDKLGIAWSYAPGSNAIAVADYVVCVIFALQKMQLLPTSGLRAGVVGVGHVGSRVVEKLKLMGFDVIQCDPLRAEKEMDFASTPLSDFHELDVITLHTPLTRSGPHPTYHLLNELILKKQKPNTILLNTSRGDVINFSDLKQYGTHCHWCFDVWENEPFISLDILERAVIATPHIAGYSTQAKYRGVYQIYQDAFRCGILKEDLLPEVTLPIETVAYDPRVTTKEMKEKMHQDKNCFDTLRRQFKDRGL